MSAERPEPRRQDDHSASGGTTSSSHAGPDGPGMPRWVKMLALAVAVVLVLMLLLMMILGGEHGPGRHF